MAANELLLLLLVKNLTGKLLKLESVKKSRICRDLFCQSSAITFPKEEWEKEREREWVHECVYVCASVVWACTCGCVCGCDCGCASTRGRKGERNLKVETPEGSHQILPLGNEKCKKSNSYFKLFLSLATHSLTYTSTLSHTHTSILKPTFVCPSHTHSTNGSSSFAHIHSITFSLYLFHSLSPSFTSE